MKLVIPTIFVSTLLCLSSFAQDNSTMTFMVQNGALPWSDRDYTLDQMPKRLIGTEAIPQQVCASREIQVPPWAHSITFGVMTSDLEALMVKYPEAIVTGETFLIKLNGTAMNYSVVTLDAPPQPVVTGPFQAGLILLKIGNGDAKAQATTSPAPTQAVPSATPAIAKPFKSVQAP